jgi:hypothetical protein
MVGYQRKLRVIFSYPFREATATGDVWYHCTERRNLPSIAKTGLRKGNSGNDPGKSGSGIYCFKSLDDARIVAEYLGFYDPVLLVVDLAGLNKLMDEDALFVDADSKHEVARLYNIMPRAAADTYMQFLETGDGDEVAYDDQEVAAFKVNLIDRYMIEPVATLPVSIGHYNIYTCRVPQMPLMSLKVAEIE